MANEAIDKVTDREMIFGRLLNSPRELVWKVWTDPLHLAHWFGPNGFTITTHNMDVEKDGSWRFMMHGPDGRDYPNKIIYLEVVKPERLVYRHADDGETEPVSFRVTITFEEEGNKTRLSMRMVFESPEELQRVEREYGAIEGGKQNIARLEEYLTALGD
ncbi:MAG: SRPBCC family protein [Bacteroidota bacterium]